MALINIQYTADIAQLTSRLDEIIAKQNQLISSSKKAGEEMSNSAKKASDEFGVLNNSIQRLGGVITAAFSVQKILEFGKAVFDTERRIELLQNRLNFLTGSTDKGSEAFLRMATISNKLGLDLETTLNGFADFGIAATQAGMSVQKAERIFISVASGLRAAGASSLQTQRAFYALQQMMSKGVVAAEELRRQLGEALPGANELMVKAYNRLHPEQELTNRQFIKMQEEGKIISREILPEFAKVIEETFAPALAGKANSLDAAVNRVTSAWLQFKLAVGDSEVFKSATNSVSGVLNAMNVALTDESLSRLERFMIITSAPRLSSMSEEELSNAVIGIERVFKQALDRQRQRADLSVSTAKAEELAVESLSASYENLNNTLRQAEMKRAINEIENNRNIIKSQEPIIKNAEEILKSKQSLVDALLKERKSYLPISEAERESLAWAVKERDIAKSALEIEKEKQKQASNTISVLQGAIKQYGLLDQAREESANSVQEIENKGLRDVIATQKIKLAQSVRGSKEELAIRQNLLISEAQLRAENEKLTAQERNAILEQAYNEAEKLTQEYNDRIFRQYQTAVKYGEKFSKDLNKTLREQLYASISDPTALDIEKTIDYYNDLIKEAEALGLDTVALEEAKYKAVEAIRKKAAEKEKKENEDRIKDISRGVEQIARTAADLMTRYMSAEQQIQKNFIQSQEQALAARVEAGLMSEEDYQGELKKLRMREFEMDKQQAITKAKIDTALSVINLFATMPWPIALALTPVMIGIGAKQVEAIQSMPMPTFHDGGVDIGGEGRITSGPLKPDEFIAKLQKGETIIDRPDTQKYKDELTAIRNGKFEDYIASKYILPALERSVDKKQGKSTQTSMEMAFQAAEMVNAIKGNKVIKLHKSSIKELAGQIKPKASDKILARRSWR